MDRPEIATITIHYIDKYGEEHNLKFSETTLEQAYEILGLMIGEHTEEDLKP